MLEYAKHTKYTEKYVTYVFGTNSNTNRTVYQVKNVRWWKGSV